jgi:hypothetical protein
MPQVSAAAIRIVGLGLGANGSELRPFNESPGTVVVLAVQARAATASCRLIPAPARSTAFADDKGQSLLEEGRIGTFPRISEDGSRGARRAEVRARPSAGATSLSVQGSICDDAGRRFEADARRQRASDSRARRSESAPRR